MVRMMAWLLGFAVGLGCVACVAPRPPGRGSVDMVLWEKAGPIEAPWHLVSVYHDISSCEEARALAWEQLLDMVRSLCQRGIMRCAPGFDSPSKRTFMVIPAGEEDKMLYFKAECIPATIDPRTK